MFGERNPQNYRHEFVMGANVLGSSLRRALYPIDILGMLVKDHHRPIMKVIEVGVGEGGFPLAMSYQPLQLAAFLDARKVNYQLTCLDIDNRLLGRLQRQQSVYFVSTHDHQYELRERRVWDEYVEWVGGRQRQIYHPAPDMWFSDYVQDEAGGEIISRRETWQLGVWAAPLPRGFVRGRGDGAVRLVLGDIATQPLRPQYDFIHCGFVLYQLSELGQQLALQNMLSALRPGGVLVFDDFYNNMSRSDWLRPLVDRSGCRQLWEPVRVNSTTYYQVEKIKHERC